MLKLYVLYSKMTFVNEDELKKQNKVVKQYLNNRKLLKQKLQNETIAKQQLQKNAVNHLKMLKRKLMKYKIN